MSSVRAAFIDGSGVIERLVIDYNNQPEWLVSRVDFSLEHRITPVEIYETQGRLPSGEVIFTLKKAGLVAWAIDQYFPGPQHNTMPAWQEVTTAQDHALDQQLKYLSGGLDHWPGQPKRPPYIVLCQEMRFHYQGKNQFLYGRRTQGVIPKRIM